MLLFACVLAPSLVMCDCLFLDFKQVLDADFSVSVVAYRRLLVFNHQCFLVLACCPVVILIFAVGVN